MHPEELACYGVQGYDVAARSCNGVDYAAHHERRRFEVVFRSGSQVCRIKTPRNLELVEVRRIDLIERRIFGVAEVAAISRPLAFLRACLRERRKRKRQE